MTATTEEGIKVKCSVTVLPAVSPEITLHVGQTYTLKSETVPATTSYRAYNDQTFILSAEASKVVNVERTSGIITALAPGEAYIKSEISNENVDGPVWHVTVTE